MNSIYFDVDLDDDSRRQQLYEGQIFVYSPRPSIKALADLARDMAEEVFAPHAPCQAQNHMNVEEYVKILAALKPNFIHHPKAKELIPNMLADLGCDLEETYFDVPRLRTVTANDYLSSGLGLAFKPHRDTWYSPPMCQLNWWIPVYDIEPDNAMAFHLRYWDRPVENSSNEFNYQLWQQGGRKQAAKHVKSDTRKQSEPLQSLKLDPQVRVICPAGGMIVFSAAHLHSTVPNTSQQTRISIDLRTVHLHEVHDNSGAPNLDSACGGTTIRDYLRGSDLATLPEEIVDAYESGSLESRQMIGQSLV